MATFNGYVVGGQLSLRASTSTSSTRYLYIPNGTNLNVTTISGNREWFATSYGGYNGYVVAAYIAITSDGGACTVATSSGSLNIRKKPVDNADVLFTAAQYSTVRLLEHNTVTGWYRVSNSNGTGWAKSNFLNVNSYPDGSANNTPGDNENSGAGTTGNVPAVTMRYGDTGNNVVMLQQRLSELRYFVGVIDGIFGYATDWAVRYFQNRNGLTDDGIVGTNTREALNSSTCIIGIDSQAINWTKGVKPHQMYMNGPYAPWKNESFDAANTTRIETIGDSANCPSAFAMIVSTFSGEAITPAHVCKFVMDSNYRDHNGESGVRSAFFAGAAVEYGLNYYNTVNTLSAIQTQLSYGRLALIRIRGSEDHDYCSTDGATYLVIYAIENGIVKVMNPNYNTREQDDMYLSDWNGKSWVCEAHIYGP